MKDNNQKELHSVLVFTIAILIFTVTMMYAK